MSTKSPLHMQSDHDLIRGFEARLKHHRWLEVDLLVYMAELMKRRLYASAGYSSMFRWCVKHYRMSEDAAFRRIRAARVGQRFPIVFEMLGDCRLHLTAVTLLSPRLNEGNAGWLLPAATGLTSNGVRDLLAQYWPEPPEPTVMQVASKRASNTSGRTGDDSESSGTLASDPVVPSSATESGDPMEPPAFELGPEAPTAPAIPQEQETHYSLRCTLDEETHALLERARELSTPGPASEVVAVLKSALETHVRELERRKFGATNRPAPTRPAKDASHIPAHVRRAVRERDKDCCTFVSEDGICCDERAGLEFDHIVPLARGGRSTVDNVRLRCRAHNQLEADRLFGTQFMDAKRGESPKREDQCTSG